MIQRILLLTFALTMFWSMRAKTVLETNPVNIGTILVDEVTNEGMADICRFYSLMPKETEDEEFFCFASGEKWEVRFKMETQNNGIETPIVEIKTSLSVNQIEKLLKKNGYLKNTVVKGNDNKKEIIYTKGYSLNRRVNKCSIYSVTPNIIRFTKTSMR